MGHGNEILKQTGSREVGEPGLDHRFCKLSGPVEPEIEKYDRIVFRDPAEVDTARFYEFVGLARTVGAAYRLFPAFDRKALSLDKRAVGQLVLLPAVVASLRSTGR
jgi:hypothetical protein